VVFDNCRTYAGLGGGFDIRGQNTTIRSGIVDSHMATRAVYLYDNVGGAKIDGLMLRNISGASQTGIQCDVAVTDLAIVNCSLDTIGSAAIYIAAAATDLRVMNNRFRAWNVANSSGYEACLRVDGIVTRGRFHNNLCEDTLGHSYGVVNPVVGSNVDFTVLGNTLHGSSMHLATPGAAGIATMTAAQNWNPATPAYANGNF
jgi:hypothetical protein